MPVCCWSCFHVVLTAANPLTPALLDANAEWSRVTLKRPKARRSCLCWSCSEFPGWAFTKLTLNLPDMYNCDLYQILSSYNVCVFVRRTSSTFWGFYILCMCRKHVLQDCAKQLSYAFKITNILVTFMSSRSVVFSWACPNRPVTCFRVMIYQLRINNLDLYSLKCQLVDWKLTNY